MSVVTERCKECLFFCDNINHFIIPTCDYFLIKGERRGCPAGDECDKFFPASEGLKIKRPLGGPSRLTVKEQDLYDLYYQGKTDTEIAGVIGVNRNTIARWRSKNGLPSQQSIRRATTRDAD